MRIADILAGKGALVLTIAPGAPVSELLALLVDRNVGAAVVLDDERLVGIVSERDVVHHLQRCGAELLQLTVSEIMTSAVVTCRSSDDVRSLSHTMTEQRIRHVPVLDTEGGLTGIVSVGDVVKSRIDQLEEHRDQLEAYISG